MLYQLVYMQQQLRAAGCQSGSYSAIKPNGIQGLSAAADAYGTRFSFFVVVDPCKTNACAAHRFTILCAAWPKTCGILVKRQ
jgi:hypothetical protein